MTELTYRTAALSAVVATPDGSVSFDGVTTVDGNRVGSGQNWFRSIALKLSTPADPRRRLKISVEGIDGQGTTFISDGKTFLFPSPRLMRRLAERWRREGFPEKITMRVEP